MPTRLVVQYTKEDKIKYISHLDMIRLIQRALRRADIPVAYSEGFNPHPRFSFGSALAVGITSEGEYLDILLEDNIEPQLFCRRMNEKLPEGIRFTKARCIHRKLPSLMSVIERAEYKIQISNKGIDPKDAPLLFHGFLTQPKIPATRTRRGENEQIDIRGMIHSMDVAVQNSHIIVKAAISTGSKKNLRPEMLLDALFDFAKISRGSNMVLGIHRLNLYLPQKDQWITPMEME